MYKNNQQMLATENIGKLLTKLSVPAGIGMFVLALYNVIDTIFIGHTVGTLGIAGLSIVFPIQMLTMGFGMMVGVGGASLVSRSLGAGNYQRAERTLGNAATLAIALSILLMTIGLANSTYWVTLFGASEAVLPFAKGYMDIILLGTIFRIVSMAAGNLIRAEGNARIPMIGMITGALLNIIMDAIFIIGLDMGVAGAALATVLAQVVVAGYYMYYYQSKKSSLNFHPHSLIPDYGLMKGILSVGIASFFRAVANSLVAIFINRILVSYGGDTSIAAYGVIRRIMMFSFMPLMAIGQGLQPILGFSYGAKKPVRAIKSIKLAIIAATVISITGFAVVFLFAEQIIAVFTSDNSLILESSVAARRIFLASYLIGFQIIGSTIFQALGKAKQSLFTATSRGILFLLPAVFILPRFLGVNGVWLSYPVADVLSSICTLALFIPQIRAIRNMNIPATVNINTAGN